MEIRTRYFLIEANQVEGEQNTRRGMFAAEQHIAAEAAKQGSYDSLEAAGGPLKITVGRLRCLLAKESRVESKQCDFYDWHTGQFTIPAKGTVVGSVVDTDLNTWPDFDGETPDLGTDSGRPEFISAVLYRGQRWDPGQDDEVPDLTVL